jgi:hypothetical protein
VRLVLKRLVIPLALLAAVVFAAASSAHHVTHHACPAGARTLATTCR